MCVNPIVKNIALFLPTLSRKGNMFFKRKLQCSKRKKKVSPYYRRPLLNNRHLAEPPWFLLYTSCLSHRTIFSCSCLIYRNTYIHWFKCKIKLFFFFLMSEQPGLCWQSSSLNPTVWPRLERGGVPSALSNGESLQLLHVLRPGGEQWPGGRPVHPPHGLRQLQL